MSQFEYVAVLISIIVGLALAQILRGIGRLITNEEAPRTYWVHLLWTIYFFLLTVLFWWWEFQLGAVEWSLPIYLVVIVYATLLFLVSVVIQPTDTREIKDYRDYYFAKRRWIFGLFITIWMWDFVDTVSKGSHHFADLGMAYVMTNLTQMAIATFALFSASERLHKVIAVLCVGIFIVFQYRTFFMLR